MFLCHQARLECLHKMEQNPFWRFCVSVALGLWILKGCFFSCCPIRPVPYVPYAAIRNAVGFDPVKYHHLSIKLSFCHLGCKGHPDMSFYRCGFNTLYGFAIQIMLQNETRNNDFNMVLVRPTSETWCVHTHPWFRAKKIEWLNIW